MRKNYFLRLTKYIKNVYHIDRQIQQISDKRVNPTYKTTQIISLVLTGFLLRIKSFNQLNFMIKTGEFNNMFSSKSGLPKIDAIRNSLKSVELSSLRKMNQSIIKKAVRNKVLDEGTVDGYTVAAIDGTKLFYNADPHCDDCLFTKNKGREYYSHSCAAMSLIGKGANLVLDYEMYKHKNEANDTGEGELITARKLANRAVLAHNGLIDFVAYDALACNSPFVNECIKLNIEAVIKVKKSNMLSIKKVKKETNQKKHIHKWRDGDQKVKVYESLFNMDGVDQPIRYIKFAKKNKDGNRSQVLIITTSMTAITKTIYKIMKARWDIENRVFNNLKNNANLNHFYFSCSN